MRRTRSQGPLQPREVKAPVQRDRWVVGPAPKRQQDGCVEPHLGLRRNIDVHRQRGRRREQLPGIRDGAGRVETEGEGGLPTVREGAASWRHDDGHDLVGRVRHRQVGCDHFVGDVSGGSTNHQRSALLVGGERHFGGREFPGHPIGGDPVSVDVGSKRGLPHRSRDERDIDAAVLCPRRFVGARRIERAT